MKNLTSIFLQCIPGRAPNLCYGQRETKAEITLLTLGQHRVDDYYLFQGIYNTL